ncbi:MAG: peptide chain release factor 2 [Candidatus Kerfeldbacteria bacterium]|nr:peptide chain release factor 2 [Candidatus Kerfeldbacteria bacterium]
MASSFEQLQELQQKIIDTWKLLRLDETRQRILDLEGKTLEPAFWNNQEQARAVSQELNDLRQELDTWEKIKTEVEDTLALVAIAEEEHDESLQADIEKKVLELQQRFEELEFYIMLSGEYDAHDAIVSIHAGAGGVDAQDWAEMLLRMMTRFCEQRGWRVQVLDLSRGGEAGVKSVTLHIAGRYAYGYLQSENGVHRLVRISPFDAEQMRHTSFALMEVIPDLGDIAEIEIAPQDLRIDVFRAGGNGGQSVNTTDSAVRIVHIPTGITVSCQNEKSQHQNKASAMKILKSKLHKLYREEQETEKRKLRGEYSSAEWGNQIRSYVLHPYKLVKDHRSEHESNNPDRVLNGDLQPFMEAYLRWKQEQNNR